MTRNRINSKTSSLIARASKVRSAAFAASTEIGAAFATEWAQLCQEHGWRGGTVAALWALEERTINGRHHDLARTAWAARTA